MSTSRYILPNQNNVTSTSGSGTPGSWIESTSQSRSSGTSVSTSTYCYSVDRFKSQERIDDGTVYGRILGQSLRPNPDARVVFYEAKACQCIGAVDAEFSVSLSQQS
ncbi:hypothetical protein VTI28DRAFT_5701 [Corynascus sepedonium]